MLTFGSSGPILIKFGTNDPWKIERSLLTKFYSTLPAPHARGRRANINDFIEIWLRRP